MLNPKALLHKRALSLIYSDFRLHRYFVYMVRAGADIEMNKKYNVKAKQLIDGRALIIIDNGKINIENCKKVGLSAHDVSFKLRAHHIYSTRKVKRAAVEQDGELIITYEGEENPKFPLITDGQL